MTQGELDAARAAVEAARDDLVAAGVAFEAAAADLVALTAGTGAKLTGLVPSALSVLNPITRPAAYSNLESCLGRLQVEVAP